MRGRSARSSLPPTCRYAVWGEALRGLGCVGAAFVLAGVLLVATERAVREAVEPPHEGPAPVRGD